jgi:serine protease
LKRSLIGACVAAAASAAIWTASAAAQPILLPTVQRLLASQHALAVSELASPGLLTLPAPPCPENGLLPAPLGNCGLGELPATGVPLLGNMSYWGGHVQVTPKIYLVYWGWGEPGAFPASKPCSAETVTEGGAIAATLACDPDGAGRQTANFVQQLGGTAWAGVQTQYYQTNGSGQQFITNPAHQLAGIWADDSNAASGLPKTSASNAAGSTNTYTDLAQEAARAVAHFGITDLNDANIVILQPQSFSDPNAASQGYCAFHDYVEPGFSKGIYNGITPGISYTNMPYVLNQGSSCGESLVNSGAAGTLDGFTIALGHEIEETVTDPGAEDISGGLLQGSLTTTNLGAWYDPLDADENGDKCAYVGATLSSAGIPVTLPIPGAMHDLTGNAGGTFAVQTLWSNEALGGVGYCAG